MRSGLYHAWPWLALPAAVWFAVESSLHVAIGQPGAALVAAAWFALAVGSVAASRTLAAARATIH